MAILQRSALVGDVTAAAGSNTTAIASMRVSSDKMAVYGWGNLVQNSSFMTPDGAQSSASSWIRSGGPSWSVVGRAVSGVPASAPSPFVLKIPPDSTTACGWYSGNFSDCRPSETIYVGCDYAASGTVTASSVKLSLYCLQADGTFAASSAINLAPTTSWQRLDTTLTVPAGSIGLRLLVQRLNNSDTSDVYLTGLSLERYPTQARLPSGSAVFLPSGGSHAAGLVPDPGSTAGTVKYLREDATWAVPSGSGTGVTNAFAFVTDGSATAAAAGGPATFRVRSSDASIVTTVQNDDATYGDNIDLRLSASLQTAISAAGVPFVASGASHAKGQVPDPGVTAGTTKFLREDATWAAPPAVAITMGAPLTNDVLVRYDGTSGTAVQGSSVALSDAGEMAIASGQVNVTKRPHTFTGINKDDANLTIYRESSSATETKSHGLDLTNISLSGFKGVARGINITMRQQSAAQAAVPGTSGDGNVAFKALMYKEVVPGVAAGSGHLVWDVESRSTVFRNSAVEGPIRVGELNLNASGRDDGSDGRGSRTFLALSAKSEGLPVDEQRTITSISLTNPVVVGFSGTNIYTDGDFVWIAGVVETTQINDKMYRVANTGASSFALEGINGTSWTPRISGGTIYFVAQFADGVEITNSKEAALNTVIRRGFTVNPKVNRGAVLIGAEINNADQGGVVVNTPRTYGIRVNMAAHEASGVTGKKGLLIDGGATTEEHIRVESTTTAKGTVRFGSLRSSTGNTVSSVYGFGRNSASVLADYTEIGSDITDPNSGHEDGALRLRSVVDGTMLTGASIKDGGIELPEVTTGSINPATNSVRIYAEDNGLGKTRLMAKFPGGAVVQLAIEP